MTTTLYNSWGEFRNSLEHVLSLTEQNLCIFDANLAQLGLNQAGMIQQLQRLLTLETLAPRSGLPSKKRITYTGITHA